MAHTKVEGVDYTPDGVMTLRGEVIAVRDSLLQPGETSVVAVVLTHVIVLLSYLADLVTENEQRLAAIRPATRREAEVVNTSFRLVRDD